MTEDDITIEKRVLAGPRLYARVYYYQGNIFGPIAIHGCDAGRVRGAVNRFIKQNRERILADRREPEYRTLTQLFDMQSS